LETEFDVEHRIQFTLQHVWWEQSRRATGPAAMKTALAILEDPACGESRMMATVLVPQRAGAVREALPAIPDTMARLDKVARTDTLPLVRAWTCALLAQDARAPQDYVDVAFEIAGLEREPLQQSELLRRTGILAALPRLPPASRRVLLQRTFALLQRIDDGQGRGYFLALDLGAGLGIAPVSPASGPFAPDPRLPEYQGPNGLLPAFFQTTVNNALAWYDKHKDD
jgi:hypothetical protein